MVEHYLRIANDLPAHGRNEVEEEYEGSPVDDLCRNSFSDFTRGFTVKQMISGTKTTLRKRKEQMCCT